MHLMRLLWGDANPHTLPSEVQLTTFPGGLFRRGDRVNIEGRIGIVDRVDSDVTVTIHWHVVWYRRAFYWLLARPSMALVCIWMIGLLLAIAAGILVRRILQ